MNYDSQYHPQVHELMNTSAQVDYDSELEYNYSDLPYYFDKYPQNAAKGKYGEIAFLSSIENFPILSNIHYGHKQKDIDALILRSNSLDFNEIKNLKESFVVSYSWFLSHILDRFVDGTPIVEFYARTLGYNRNQVKKVLVIPKLNASRFIRSLLKGSGIEVVETKKQLTDNSLLKERALNCWYFAIRRFFLSVYNNRHYSKKNKTKYEINCDSVQKNDYEQKKLTDFLTFRSQNNATYTQKEDQSLQKAIPRILTCKECRFFNECKLVDKLKQIKNKIDQMKQANLISLTNRTSNKPQYMSLVKEFFNAKDKLLSCLRKRRYQHNILEYNIFHEPYDESVELTLTPLSKKS